MNDHKRRNIFRQIIFGLSLGTILILAGGLPNLRFQPGKPLHLFQWMMAIFAPYKNTDTAMGDGIMVSFVIVFWLMLVFSIIYAVISPKFRRELVRMILVILPFVLLLPYLSKALNQESMPAETQALPGNFPIGETIFPEPPPFINNPPGWFLLLVKVFLLTLFFALIYLIWRRIRHAPDVQAVVVKNIRKALTNLELGSEFNDVVIACYVKMCQELKNNRGVRRHQAMTPREFEVYLTNAGISSSHIRQLTMLFESVRYGANPTDTATEYQAVHSLQAILQAYGK